MKVLVVGDIHGDFEGFNEVILRNQADLAIQCGDSAYYWTKTDNKSKINPCGSAVFMIPGNHECVSASTEVLTSAGFALLSHVESTVCLAQYRDRDQKITFHTALSMHKKKSKHLIHFSSPRLAHSCTPAHQVLYKKSKHQAKDLLTHSYKERVYEKDFVVCGRVNNPRLRLPKLSQKHIPKDIKVEDCWLRLLVWVLGDGTMVNHNKYVPGSIKIRIQFKLSKQRKIERLRELLDTAGIAYTFTTATKSKSNKLQPYYIRIYGDDARCLYTLLEGKKHFPAWIRKLSTAQVKVLIHELGYVDGSFLNDEKTVLLYSTVDKCDADMIQELCVLHGMVCSIKQVPQHKDAFGTRDMYKVRIYTQPKKLPKYPVTITKQEEYNDMVYCVTMPEGTLITRVDGKVCITGNCWTTFEEVVGRRGPEPVEVESKIYQCPIGSTIEVEGKVILFVGGADSIDKHLRYEGVNWFPQEVLTKKDVDYILQSVPKADIIISHTCPNEFDVKSSLNKWYPTVNDPSREVLSILLHHYKPERWYFGHWHQYVSGKYKNTDWMCLDRLGGVERNIHIFELTKEGIT